MAFHRGAKRPLTFLQVSTVLQGGYEQTLAYPGMEVVPFVRLLPNVITRGPSTIDEDV